MATFRTPLRYPGGKQRLWPFLSEVLVENDLLGGHYAEAYAGGAGIAVELLLRGLVTCIHLNDSCRAIYSFWHSILKEPERFCRKISRASLTVDEWKKQREIFRQRKTINDTFDLGFATFYLNRTNRSGILNGGVIGGLDQTGPWKMDARFPRNDLITRIESIAAKRNQIRIRNWDAVRFITKYTQRLPAKSLIYCDPPYFQKADRLYYNHYKESDHAEIAQIIQKKLERPWVVSYDQCADVRQLYRDRRRFSYRLQYNAAKAYKGAEVFIFSDGLRIPKHSTVAIIECALRRAA
jgi:DNA adenine methylase